MQAPLSETTLLPATPEKDPAQAGHVLYQSATILAILLFLISLWSC